MGTNQFEIFYDPSLDAVVMKWEGYFTSDQFRKGTHTMAELIMKHNCKKVLALISNMVLIGQEDQKWLQEQFLPEAINKGFKAIAILTPIHYFNKVAIENIINRIDKQKLDIRLFNVEEEARNWIGNLNATLI
jgi:hypothetical protein